MPTRGRFPGCAASRRVHVPYEGMAAWAQSAWTTTTRPPAAASSSVVRRATGSGTRRASGAPSTVPTASASGQPPSSAPLTCGRPSEGSATTFRPRKYASLQARALHVRAPAGVGSEGSNDRTRDPGDGVGARREHADADRSRTSRRSGPALAPGQQADADEHDRPSRERRLAFRQQVGQHRRHRRRHHRGDEQHEHQRQPHVTAQPHDQHDVEHQREQHRQPYAVGRSERGDEQRPADE